MGRRGRRQEAEFRLAMCAPEFEFHSLPNSVLSPVPIPSMPLRVRIRHGKVNSGLVFWFWRWLRPGHSAGSGSMSTLHPPVVVHHDRQPPHFALACAAATARPRKRASALYLLRLLRCPSWLDRTWLLRPFPCSWDPIFACDGCEQLPFIPSSRHLYSLYNGAARCEPRINPCTSLPPRLRILIHEACLQRRARVARTEAGAPPLHEPPSLPHITNVASLHTAAPQRSSLTHHGFDYPLIGVELTAELGPPFRPVL